MELVFIILKLTCSLELQINQAKKSKYEHEVFRHEFFFKLKYWECWNWNVSQWQLDDEWLFFMKTMDSNISLYQTEDFSTYLKVLKKEKLKELVLKWSISSYQFWDTNLLFYEWCNWLFLAIQRNNKCGEKTKKKKGSYTHLGLPLQGYFPTFTVYSKIMFINNTHLLENW